MTLQQAATDYACQLYESLKQVGFTVTLDSLPDDKGIISLSITKTVQEYL